jgi:hypothetical protein
VRAAWKPTNRKETKLYRSADNLVFSSSLQAMHRASPSREDTAQIVDRLFNEAKRKQELKKQYEEEKLKNETKDCTFTPNQ